MVATERSGCQPILAAGMQSAAASEFDVSIPGTQIA
jgi:hypothetical protein